MLKPLLGSILLLSLAACAKHDSPAPTSPPAMANQPPAKVLAEKYEKSVLICQLWSERSLDGKVKNQPVDSFAIDLKRAPRIAGDVSLAGETADHFIAVTISLGEPKTLGSLTLNTQDATYVMRNTITVPFRYSYKSSTKLGHGQSVQGSGERTYDDSIYEQVPYLVFQTSESMEPSNGNIRLGGYTDRVECLLETKINPAYAGDFQKTSN